MNIKVKAAIVSVVLIVGLIVLVFAGAYAVVRLQIPAWGVAFTLWFGFMFACVYHLVLDHLRKRARSKISGGAA